MLGLGLARQTVVAAASTMWSTTQSIPRVLAYIDSSMCRVPDVVVGRLLPPSSERVADFIQYFESRFR